MGKSHAYLSTFSILKPAKNETKNPSITFNKPTFPIFIFIYSNLSLFVCVVFVSASVRKKK